MSTFDDENQNPKLNRQFWFCAVMSVVSILIAPQLFGLIFDRFNSKLYCNNDIYTAQDVIIVVLIFIASFLIHQLVLKVLPIILGKVFTLFSVEQTKVMKIYIYSFNFVVGCYQFVYFPFDRKQNYYDLYSCHMMLKKIADNLLKK